MKFAVACAATVVDVVVLSIVTFLISAAIIKLDNRWQISRVLQYLNVIYAGYNTPLSERKNL